MHDAKAHGDKAMKVLGVYIVDKTKPLASPAPLIQAELHCGRSSAGWFVLEQRGERGTRLAALFSPRELE